MFTRSWLIGQFIAHKAITQSKEDLTDLTDRADHAIHADDKLHDDEHEIHPEYNHKDVEYSHRDLYVVLLGFILVTVLAWWVS